MKIFNLWGFRAYITLLLLLAGGLCSTSIAQPAERPDSSDVSVLKAYNQYKISTDKPGIHEFSVWGGYSFHSSQGVWGKTSGAKLSIMGFRYNRKLLNFPGQYLLKYVLETNLYVHYQLTNVSQDAALSALSGFGMTPAGLQLNWRASRWVQPFFKSSAGFMHLSNPFPDDRGTKFNFTLEIGGGLEIKLTDNSFFTIGYKYHHMSNGQLGRVNPGVDSNVFYGGITIF